MLGILRLLLLLLAALPYAHTRNMALIGMDETPSNAKLQHLLRMSDPTPRNLDAGVYPLLQRHLHEDDWHKIRRCRDLIDRKRYDALAADRLNPKRCRNEMWCPKCSGVEWGIRRRYHTQKLRSISPERHLCCFHLVFTLPDLFTPILLKSSAAREAFIWAAWGAIRRSWDPDAPGPGEHGEYRSNRRFGEAYGAIINLHPWGDERKNRHDPRKPTWPVWRPHLDILMAGHRIMEGQLVPLRETWPVRFPRLRALYREELRAAFTPLLGHLDGLERMAEAHHHLESEFPVVCWVSPSGGGKQLQHEGQAIKRIEYSSRTLWDPARVLVDHEAGEDVVIYPTQGGRARHRVPARLLFPMLYELKQFTVGKEAHRYWGFFGKNKYAKTARMAGNEPAQKSPRTESRLVATYYPNHRGEYDAVQQVILPGLGRASQQPGGSA